MAASVESAIPFVDPETGKAVPALKDAQIRTTSEALGWSDVHVEVGKNPRPWDVDALTVASHYIALNTDETPLRFEADVDGRPTNVVLAPGEMWFCPAGETFTHHVPTPAGFALVTLAPAKLARSVERADGVSLRRAYGVDRPQLSHLVRALAAETERGGPSGAAFVDALGIALAVQIVEAFGQKAPASEAHALSPRALRRVLERVDASLDDRLTVEALAQEAGLSPAHFARAFKAATGKAPHQFVLQRRLDEARRALEAPGADILNVALRFGFADQAHLTRLFKRAFGTTPGRFVRSLKASR